MSGHQTATINDTVFFWFAANDTSGSGGDGATPLFDVREAGAAASAIPLLSGAATLLTHANFPPGCHEIAVDATTGNGFAVDDTFAVFCAIAIDSQNPTGLVGSCTLTPLAKATALATAQADLDIITGSAGALIDDGTGSGQIALTAGAIDNVILVDTTTTNLDTTTPPTAAAIVDEWESQSQADPTGFHVNVLEVNSLAEDIATEAKQDIIDGNVDDIEAVTSQFAFTVADQVDSNILAISDDTSAAANLELMYDGTGYNDPTAPASRAQADGLSAGSGGSVNIQAGEDNTGGAIIDGVTFVGSVQSGTFASTEAEDGILHDIDDTADDIDIVYGFAVGGGRTASEVAFAGFVQGNGDEMKIKVFDHVGSDWEIIETVPGQNGTSNINRNPPLLLKHTGTGSELGNVYIRFETDSTTPSNLSVDRLIVSAVSSGQSVGYANGQIWIDTNKSNTGTEAFVDGVADNPVSTIAAAKTLSTSVGLNDFHIANGSSITFAESSENESYFGNNGTLNLNGVACGGIFVQGATINGVGTSSGEEMHFKECDINTVTMEQAHFDECGFFGTFTANTTDDYEFHGCYAKGDAVPVFNKTGGQTLTAEFVGWSGDITMNGLESGDIVILGGTEIGDLIINGADGTVDIRGIYKSITDNRTGSPILILEGAIKGDDVEDILVDTSTTLPDIIDDLAIKKNTVFSNFEFLMVLTSDGRTPATGLTVTGQRSIDGGAFAGVAGTITEVSNGIYQFDALAADTNGDVITWRFTEATTDDTFVTFKTVQ